ncbi:ABC transporter ATP-binding protein [Alicyclobacillus sp. ALC3]|uniref:ABC transporter ATP-binding protein n=1 Tax=Alicyclobacillus sp. ALC3 TaxID=2796143 RepID=UPI002379DE26|nr:ABC transporter ATP-binding protein [Alicyclobacillus sp. ALC3]WDL97953.1 ABC transporter ATP-binding protein [Alicyclobacillus sp. ALC3]
MANVLDVKSLNVEFNVNGTYFHAVRDVSFYIRPGETLGLVGESGCGKSVTSLAIVRLLARSARISGQVMYDDKDLLTFPQDAMREVRGNEISMIFQEPMTSLNPVYKIGAQIAEVILLHKDVSRREAFNQSLEMLQKVGIPRPKEILEEYPHQLSGGMRQRIMIAIAMACNPRLLIADEPTTALDVTIQAQILELMKEVSESFGTSTLLITHDLGVVAETCERVAVMYAGQIVEEGTVEEIFFEPQHPYTRGLLNAIPKIDATSKQRLQPIDGTVPSLTKMPTGCHFAPRCPFATQQCVDEAPSLFTVHDRHTSRCWLNESEGVRTVE